MEEREMYVLPHKEKRELTRATFIVYCIAAAILCFIFLNTITFWMFGSYIGYFPTGVILVIADILHMWGCLYYIRKHDFAYGRSYEKYQIVNAVIYGIQNYMRTLLVVLIVGIMIVPLYYTIILLVISIALFRLTRRL